MTRVYAVADTSSLDPTYAEGITAAIGAAIDYTFGFIELGERRAPPPPPILLAQARLAARWGVGLDTVLRRYVAGHSLLVDFAVEEAERSHLLDNAALKALLRGQASVFDRLLEAVSEEYAREAETRISSTDEHRAERIERLLAGELLDTSDFTYDFQGHHLAVIAKGKGADETIRELATALDRRLLSVRREDDVFWSWFGGRHTPESDDLRRIVAAAWPPEVVLALGEAGQGLSGWRLTHRQARAALPIAIRGGKPIVRYADVAILAAVVRDHLLATSLHRLYLDPLEAEHDGGVVARETLRAYFKSGCNISSAAVALGVNRNTVANRLRAIEVVIGRPLTGCGPELEAALCLSELGSPR
ncbi:MAG: PucR family transcriptional regulator [Solirubrobacterales bacterium]